MAAAAARVLRTVKPHVPLIKFPARGSPASTSTPPTPTASVTKTASSDSKAIGKTPRGSGIDDFDLPLRYQRKIISQDEIECIEVSIERNLSLETEKPESGYPAYSVNEAIREAQSDPNPAVQSDASAP